MNAIISTVPMDFQFAYYITNYFERADWLQYRLVCRECNYHFEALCKDQTIMMGLGRKLGGNPENIDIFKFTCNDRNYSLYRDAFRATVRRLPPERKLPGVWSLLEYDIRTLPECVSVRDHVNYVYDNEFDALVRRYWKPSADIFRVVPVLLAASAELASELIKARPAYRHIAFHCGVEAWDVYKELELGCPYYMRRCDHATFVHKALMAYQSGQLKGPIRVNWKSMCEKTMLIVLKTPLDIDYIEA